MLNIIWVMLVIHVMSLMWHVLQGSRLTPSQGELSRMENCWADPECSRSGCTPPSSGIRINGTGCPTVLGSCLHPERHSWLGLPSLLSCEPREREAEPGGDSLPTLGTQLPHTVLP